MPRYDLTLYAEEDLRQIVEYSRTTWGAAQAIKYLEGLELLAERLAANPKLGTDRSALLEGLLSFPYRSHMLFYLEEAFGITVLRVLHQRMDVVRHLSPGSPEEDGPARQ